MSCKLYTGGRFPRQQLWPSTLTHGSRPSAQRAWGKERDASQGVAFLGVLPSLPLLPIREIMSTYTRESPNLICRPAPDTPVGCQPLPSPIYANPRVSVAFNSCSISRPLFDP